MNQRDSKSEFNYEPEGWEFESLRARHSNIFLQRILLSELRGSCFWSDTEISAEVENVVRFYAIVQTFENRLIHFLNSFERAIAVSNDVLAP